MGVPGILDLHHTLWSPAPRTRLRAPRGLGHNLFTSVYTSGTEPETGQVRMATACVKHVVDPSVGLADTC